jgi:hypothetical protein
LEKKNQFKKCPQKRRRFEKKKKKKKRKRKKKKTRGVEDTGEGQVSGETAGLRGSRLPFGGVQRLPAK